MKDTLVFNKCSLCRKCPSCKRQSQCTILKESGTLSGIVEVFFPSCLLFYHLSSQCESFCIEVSSYGEDQFTVQSKTVVKQPVIFKQRRYL